VAVDIFVIDILAVYGLIMAIDFVWDNWFKKVVGILTNSTQGG